jgi:hypothetical protein
MRWVSNSESRSERPLVSLAGSICSLFKNTPQNQERRRGLVPFVPANCDRDSFSSDPPRHAGRATGEAQNDLIWVGLPLDEWREPKLRCDLAAARGTSLVMGTPLITPPRGFEPEAHPWPQVALRRNWSKQVGRQPLSRLNSFRRSRRDHPAVGIRAEGYRPPLPESFPRLPSKGSSTRADGCDLRRCVGAHAGTSTA